jgi:5-methylcytosine-specific restriction endonuclease McrA
VGKKVPMKERIEWMQFRDKWMMDKKLICEYCGKQLQSDAPHNPQKPKDHIFKRKQDIHVDLIATVDHISPVSKGGERFDPTNLVVCCRKCNSDKKDLTVAQWKEKTNELKNDIKEDTIT